MGAPVMRLESSRQPDDCAVWALSTYLGIPYGDVWKAVKKRHPKGPFTGLYTATILRVAADLGRPLKKRRTWTIEDVYGILSVEWKEGAHTVVVRNDLVFDVDQTVWDLHAWLEHYKLTVEYLLTED